MEFGKSAPMGTHIEVPNRGNPGKMITLSEALGTLFHKHLSQIITLGNPADTRVLFCFED